MVLVKWEAGIGKSRLLREATGRLESATVMWGGCHPLREPLPFGPVIDALRSADLHIGSQAKLSAATAALAPYLVLTCRAEDLPEHGNALGAPYRRPVGVGGTEITLSPFTESEVREPPCR
ncbi:hypothetical protein ACFVZ8_00140 [Streptomyces sp. NPDC059558]|uniref:hypothetical protein n=1 Tax=Streptomyces sp. NPDC059558 TaxID=3346864 RepID=UPI0036810102